MNSNQPSQSGLTVYFIGILGALLIVAIMVWAIYRYANPPPLGSNRAAERAKNLADQRALDAAVNQYGAEPGRPFVRVPVSDAMKQTIKDYQNADASKKELAARVDKANPPPPAPPTEKPSQYE